MNGPDHEPTPPPALKERVVRSLRSRGVLRSGNAWTRALTKVAAGLVVFAAGAAAGRATSTQAAGADEPEFLLALHEDEGFRPSRPLDELVREYGDWGAALAAQGRLVAAEQLDGSLTVLPAGGPAAEIGDMTGFFLIRAPSAERALATALTHPHLGYGGRIAVRGVVR